MLGMSWLQWVVAIIAGVAAALVDDFRPRPQAPPQPAERPPSEPARSKPQRPEQELKVTLATDAGPVLLKGPTLEQSRPEERRAPGESRRKRRARPDPDLQPPVAPTPTARELDLVIDLLPETVALNAPSDASATVFDAPASPPACDPSLAAGITAEPTATDPASAAPELASPPSEPPRRLPLRERLLTRLGTRASLAQLGAQDPPQGSA